MKRILRPLHFGLSAAVLLALAACGHSKGGSTTSLPQFVAAPPAGSLVLGHKVGAVTSPAALRTPNPLDGNAQAREAGHQLYLAMNCATCHAYDGSGNQGPPLNDTRWRYGGLPVQVYDSIRDGRPKGMPAFGDRLAPEQLWELVSYVESFGGTLPADFYQHAVQGDTAGEQEAPEANAQVQSPPEPATGVPPAAAAKPPQ